MKTTSILFFFFISFCSFSQVNNSKATATSNGNKDSLSVKVVSLSKDSNANPLLNRVPYPVNQKAGPEIFYVKNDKPIERALSKPVKAASSERR